MLYKYLQSSILLVVLTVVLTKNVYTTLEQANTDIYKWSSVASSGDGLFLAATIANYGIVTANDYGFALGIGRRYGYDWLLSDAPYLNWKSIAMSSGKEVLCAVVNGGGIYTSLNEGSQWNKTSVYDAAWSTVAISDTGQYLFAAQNQVNSSLYVSNDFGTVWNPSHIGVSLPWCAVSCSSSGQYVAIVACNGGLYLSSNFASSFTLSKAGTAHWTTVASDGSGRQIAAAVTGGRIHISHDFGVTWSITTAPVANWKSIVSSGPGRYMYAVVYEGGMFYSKNNGTDWSLSKSPSARWSAITTSSNGDSIAATEYGGYVYANHIDLLLYVPTFIVVTVLSVLLLYSVYRCYRQYRRQRRAGYVELTSMHSTMNPFSVFFAKAVEADDTPTKG